MRRSDGRSRSAAIDIHDRRSQPMSLLTRGPAPRRLHSPRRDRDSLTFQPAFPVPCGCGDGTCAHDRRIDPSGRPCGNSGKRRQPARGRILCAHQDDGRGAVMMPEAFPRSPCHPCKGRLQFGERLEVVRRGYIHPNRRQCRPSCR